MSQSIRKFWSWFITPQAPYPYHGDPPLVESQGWSWGRFPALAAVGALCLFVVAWGLNAARANNPYYELIFWLGLLPFYALITWRLLSTEASRRERVALILFASIGMYLVKIMHSPIYFTFYDELLHYRTVANILATGHQFAEHPLLPVSPLYPGLENIAVALIQLGGLDIYTAGVITILIARTVFVFVLFFFMKRQPPHTASPGLPH